MTPFTVVGVAGSLRHDSYNRALLHAAAKLAPDDVTFTIFDLDDVPLYDEDHDEYRGGDDMPEAVVALREAIAAARFDEDLALADDEVAGLLREQLAALRRWAGALRNHG
jgi:hypothetical protein